MGTAVAVAAIAMGAVMVEKHVTLVRADGGVDSAFSLEPSELARLVSDTDAAWRAMGAVRYGPTEREKPSLQFRRSLYVADDMKSGDVFTQENLRVVRPGLGLPPKFYEVFLGRRILRAAAKGTPLTWDLLG
jgi:N-acetylneuraminate synthase